MTTDIRFVTVSRAARRSERLNTRRQTQLEYDLHNAVIVTRRVRDTNRVYACTRTRTIRRDITHYALAVREC